MADAMATDLFDLAAEKLEGRTDMDRLAARGTLRIALKEAGLDAQKLTVPQLRAVFEKLMPKELEARGVNDAAATCQAAMNEIASSADSIGIAPSVSADDVFKRLGES
jgi:hypothetical protein